MSPLFACLHAPGNLPLAVECARGFSPYIEENPPDTVIFDVRGLESLYGPPERLAREIERRIGVPASIAIAANPDAAMHAAHGIRGVTVIAPGREAEALAPLPVNLLATVRVKRPSCCICGAFARSANLPDCRRWAWRRGWAMKASICSVWRAAKDTGSCGPWWIRSNSKRRWNSTIRWNRSSRCRLSWRGLLNDVCGRLGARSLATNEIRLRLTLENAPEHAVLLRLPVPMLDAKAFLKMLQLDLSGRPPVAPVLKVHLQAEPVKPRRTQQGLFVPSSPEPEKLELTVARLRHLVGDGQVGTPELKDTHRPDSFFMRGFAPRQAVAGRTAVAESPLRKCKTRGCVCAASVRRGMRR